MLITEIFRSIQGESSRAGLPCIFVRLTGCNLRCTWCDTAYSFYGGVKLTLDEVLAEVHRLAHPAGDAGPAVPLVEITGGEPLLQSDTPELAARLLASGFSVLVETSGERSLAALPNGVVKIVDVKCPDSGEPETFALANLDLLTAADEMKFVISSRRDFEFARDFTATHRLASRVRQVLFSPVHASPDGQWPGLDSRLLAEWILAEALPVRLNLQIHKFIWHPSTRGV